MKLLGYFPILIILLLCSIPIFSAEIKGIVTDSRTGEPLIGANVYILGTSIGAAADINGFYIIKDLAPGKYIIKASFVVYKSHIDSVSISGQDEIIELNFTLKSPIVDLDSVSTPQLEAYHEKLEEMNKLKQVVLINIDNLIYSEDYLTAYLSMTNNTDDSFYIFMNYSCFNVIKPIIIDSTGKLIKQNMLMFDCDGEKTCPDSGDLILIKPDETIKYPATKLQFYNFSHIPKGKYSIQIKYEFPKPKEINTFWQHNVEVLISGLRGTYISSNALEFINQ